MDISIKIIIWKSQEYLPSESEKWERKGGDSHFSRKLYKTP